MKSIEEVIDNIVDEHKECRWMDASELRGYLEVVAREQKDLDDKLAFEEREKAFKEGYNTAIRYACDWIGAVSWIDDFRKAMEE